MPNDNPDWTNAVATPAIDLGAFSVPANTIATVYNGPLPAGTHAIKVFVKSTDPSNNAQQVTIIDPADAHTIASFFHPIGTSLVTAVDDVTTPNIRVDVQAAVTQASTGRVVAFLSDQAVTVDNDPNSPVPIIGPGSGGRISTVSPGGQPAQVISAANAAASLIFNANFGATYFLHSITISYSGATAGAPTHTVTVAAVSVWEVLGGNTSSGIPPLHWTFPNGGLKPAGTNTTFAVNMAASGVAGIAGVLSIVYELRPD